MSDTVNISIKEFHDNLRSSIAAARTKSASALKATDPNYQGNPEIPSFNTEKNRSNINLPNNPNNLRGPQDVDGTQGLCTVTKPSGVGQADYPTPVNGNARDAAFVTPSTPISKCAGNLINSTIDSFEMPANIKNDIPLMQKLAFIGGQVMSTKKGIKLVDDLMAKQAGIIEAQNIIREVQNDIYKQASTPAMTEQQCYANHAVNLNTLQYAFEKNAYMQGAMDGEQTADATAVGSDQAIAPEMGDISDEEAMAAIQALVESGQVPAEAAQAFLANIAQDQMPAYTGQQIAQMIAADVQSGALDPQVADAIAAELLQNIEAGNIPVA